MATWVRSFTSNLIGTVDLDLVGPADLDTDTIPGDFDETAINSVRFQFTLSHTGTFDTGTGADSYNLARDAATGVEIETSGGTQLATVTPSGQITDGTATVVIDLTDSSPNTGASQADWQGAQFNGTNAATIADFVQGKGPDGVSPQILLASVTITIDYTPSAVTVDLDAAISGTATVGSAVKLGRDLTAAPSGTATVASALDATTQLTAAPTGTATVTADLTSKGYNELAAAISGTGTVGTSVHQTVQLSAVISGTASVAANLTQIATNELTAVMSGTATVTSALTQINRLSVAVSGTATLTAVLTTKATNELTAAPQGTATVTSSLDVLQTLTATISGTATISTTLSVVSAGTNNLTATFEGTATIGTVLSNVGINQLTAVFQGTATIAAAIRVAGQPLGFMDVQAQLVGAVGVTDS